MVIRIQAHSPPLTPNLGNMASNYAFFSGGFIKHFKGFCTQLQQLLKTRIHTQNSGRKFFFFYRSLSSSRSRLAGGDRLFFNSLFFLMNEKKK